MNVSVEPITASDGVCRCYSVVLMVSDEAEEEWNIRFKFDASPQGDTGQHEH